MYLRRTVVLNRAPPCAVRTAALYVAHSNPAVLADATLSKSPPPFAIGSLGAGDSRANSRKPLRNNHRARRRPRVRRQAGTGSWIQWVPSRARAPAGPCAIQPRASFYCFCQLSVGGGCRCHEVSLPCLHPNPVLAACARIEHLVPWRAVTTSRHNEGVLAPVW